MEHATIAGNYYLVTSKNGGTVTDASGTLKKPVEAGDQITVGAPSDKLLCDDEEAIIRRANFKRAALALGLLGGGESSGLPAGYKRVEWLYKPSSSAFAEVGTFLCSGFEVDIKNDNYGVTRFIGGSCQSLSSSLGIRPFYLRGNNPDKLAFCQGDYYGFNVNNFSTFKRFTCKLTRSKVLLDGEEQTSFTAFTDTPRYDEAQPVYIGQVAGASQGIVYYYSVKIWGENEKLKHDFVPAIGPLGEPCFFDLLSGEPLYSNGAVDFTAPSVTTTATTYSLRKPRMYAQKTPRGIRRLYHVPKGYNGTPEEYAAENGFKVLVETPAPEEGYWAPVWHEREDCIELEWVETEPPTEQELLTETE